MGKRASLGDSSTSIAGLVAKLFRVLREQRRRPRRPSAVGRSPSRAATVRRLAIPTIVLFVTLFPLIWVVGRAPSESRPAAPTAPLPRSPLAEPAEPTTSAEVSMPVLLASNPIEPNVPHLFPTRRGYAALYRSRPEVYSVVALGPDGKALEAPQRIQVTDCVSALPIGDRIVVAFGRHRNRGEDGEPFKDDLSVWTYSPGSGALEQIFLLPKQAVLFNVGPRILPGRGGAFSVLWGTYDGHVLSQSFDASGRAVGRVVRSPSYGDQATALALAPLRDSHLGVLVTADRASDRKALLLLPRLDPGTFPEPVRLFDDVAGGWPRIAALPMSADSVGVVWHAGSERRLWFGLAGESGFLSAPVLVRESERPSRLIALTTAGGGLTLLWSEVLDGFHTATLTEDGRIKTPPRKVEGDFPVSPALAWTGRDHRFISADPGNAQCPLRTGRLSAALDKVIESGCAL